MAEQRAADVWVVLPTYDEAENLEKIVPAIAERLPDAHRILVVDDNSPDGTGEIADRLAAERGDLAVIHRPGKEGIGPAYLAGFARALTDGAKTVVQMDADFAHDPAYLPELIAATRQADLAIGSRYVRGGGVENWGAMRRTISKGGSTYARKVLGVGVRDLTGGFKAWRSEALSRIDLDRVATRGYAFQVEMTYRALCSGMKVVEVPIVFKDRDLGASKMSRSIFLEAIWRVPALRFGPNAASRKDI
ncbi:MAG: polyprenol monophosphomannose synthase [bacterium]